MIFSYVGAQAMVRKRLKADISYVEAPIKVLEALQATLS